MVFNFQGSNLIIDVVVKYDTLSSNVNSKDFYAHRSYTPHFNRQEKWIQKSGVW